MSTLDRDDALLDGLGLGGAAHADDPLAGMLAAWRTDLAEPPFAPSLDLDLAEQAALADPIDLDDVLGNESEEPEAVVLRPAAKGRSGLGSARPAGRRDGSARPQRGGRPRPRLMLAAALLVAVLGGGLVVGAGAGQPGTPLWPVTQLVYAERADSRVAAQDVEDLLAQADRALREQRPGDAEQLLRQSWDRLGEVREKSDHERLRAELMRLLTAFAAITAPTTAPSAPPTPGTSPRPTGGTTTPTTGPAGTPAPGPTPGSGGLLPGLPPLLPSLPPILPSLLPDLPLL
ncbi:hypothetical protein [Catellatospora citrea]|uniref:Anti-sigma-D factor RsdA-like protein n=1 Tax=Catellatospora citrea TaxID=53366 RepID=A0A8J3P427_9ACTN|nr:hypothetical protein [Catellatospora citrea]RKE10922.1 hypothetical protein C8E86_5841 [Catellatospora citrea]GIG02957.1 hypothetical protein Cci01nite_80500 [Catellatospora citrea]